MALGDGVTWIETGFTNASSADTIDDETTDIRKGIRSRLANEHEWPSSQTGTAQAGMHKYLTLQATTAPSALVTGTQRGAIALGSSGTGYEFYCAANITGATAGTDIQMSERGRLVASKIISLTADPGSPIAGQIWFRSDL